MPRVARIVVPGTPHHITQRGNNRQDVFFTEDDRRFYLRTLTTRCRRYSVRVLAYCLMTNHVHLVVVPEDAEGLARALGTTHHRYARYINEYHGRSGHLWQNRFFSAPMDNQYTVAAIKYVERNPVRAGFVRHPWEYRWSSAATHCGCPTTDELIDRDAWQFPFTPAEWMPMVATREDADAVGRLRTASLRGRPLGSDRFIARLEAVLGRRLRPNRVGRPSAGQRE